MTEREWRKLSKPARKRLGAQDYKREHARRTSGHGSLSMAARPDDYGLGMGE